MSSKERKQGSESSAILPHDHSGLSQILHKFPKEQEFTIAADIFSQLCDSTRLKVLWILCHSEECVTDVAAAIDMSSPAVSHHLRTLRQSGLIVSRREGKEVLYSLANTEKAQLIHKMIDAIFRMNCF